MQVIDNFESSFKKFLDARQSWENYSELTSNENILMPNGFKAYCKEEGKWYQLSTEDEDDPSTYVWNEESNIDEIAAVASTAIFNAEEAKQYASAALALAQQSSGSITTEAITANIDVGGISEGDVVQQGKNLTEVLKQILIKYFPPKITYITSEPLINKKGSIVPGVDFDINIIKTVEDLNSYSLSLNDTELASGNNPSGGSIQYSYSDNISANTIFTVNADDGKDGAIEQIKFEFINPYYYGNVNTNELDDFSDLVEDISKKNTSKKVSYTANAEYLVFAYDSSYGNLTSIKDKNNFENLPAFVKSTKIIDSETYNVYISADKITCSNFEYTFKI